MQAMEHPPCPTCGTNKHVVQQVRVVEDEHREDDYREVMGSGWMCTQCGEEWDRTRSWVVERELTPTRIDPNTYDIANDDWDRMLGEIIGDLSAATLMQIPGVYEILSEHFNNEIIDQWQQEQEEGNADALP
ncbi:MAG: hypothetical protein OEU26_30980 [Candidatus Tectomicrobia bacterium]|nr:hypothetical protein [Candidatus Tectomicrobia bacterium]